MDAGLACWVVNQSPLLVGQLHAWNGGGVAQVVFHVQFRLWRTGIDTGRSDPSMRISRSQLSRTRSTSCAGSLANALCNIGTCLPGLILQLPLVSARTARLYRSPDFRPPTI